MENTTLTGKEAVNQNGSESPAPFTREEGRYLVPPVDIYEDNDGLTVVVDLPGVQKDAIDIRVENGRLSIEGRQPTHSIAGDSPYAEFQLMNFYRQFALSDEVEQEGISADLKHGVLTLHLPKAEKAKPKKIEVAVGD